MYIEMDCWTLLWFQIQATDADSGKNGAVEYYLDTWTDMFSVDPETGNPTINHCFITSTINTSIFTIFLVFIYVEMSWFSCYKLVSKRKALFFPYFKSCGGPI